MVNLNPPPMKNIKRETTEEKKEEPSLLLSLPNELIFMCIACVSRLYYPTLSLVCKRFRSLVASPELYNFRSLLGRAESCLYVCLFFRGKMWWFSLFRKPDQTGYVLVNFPAPTGSRSAGEFSNLVAVGSNIYNIASGCFYGDPSSTVSVLDCRSHTWLKGPSLPVELFKATATVIDQKIYVLGFDNWVKDSSFQVLDTTTQIWNTEPEPVPRLIDKFYYSRSACVDGKFHVQNSHTYEEISYSPKDGKWELLREPCPGLNLYANSYCEIENILYREERGEIVWLYVQAGVRRWRPVKGFAEQLKLPMKSDYDVRLADYGGKIAVFWAERFSTDTFRIWCAVIAVVRPKSCEILGKVEWCAPVLIVPYPSCFFKALSATL